MKILDFGLAKLMGNVTLTRTGTTMGTVAYMSPEQARGEKVDRRADIWSLGVVLYEMLTGKLPFKGDNEQAMIYSILNAEYRPVKQVRREIPDTIDSLIKKSLTKEPINRFQDTSELMVDLSAKVPWTDPFRSDPRYEKIVKKMKFISRLEFNSTIYNKRESIVHSRLCLSAFKPGYPLFDILNFRKAGVSVFPDLGEFHNYFNGVSVH